MDNGGDERRGCLVAEPFNGRDAATRAGVCCRFGTVVRVGIWRVDNLFPLGRDQPSKGHIGIDGSLKSAPRGVHDGGSDGKKGLTTEHTQAYMTTLCASAVSRIVLAVCIVGLVR